MKQRLAESFEAALRIADGRVIALRLATTAPATPSTCSATASPARCAATRWPNWSRGCSRSIRRWRLPAVRRLSQVTAFDPSAWWPSRRSARGPGAIKGWDHRNGYTFSLLESVARHYGFDIEAPFEDGPPQQARAKAAARQRRRSDRVRLRGRRQRRSRRSVGVRATRSKASCPASSGAGARPIRPPCARNWRATAGQRPCPACQGSRLRREARHVRLDQAAWPRPAHLPVSSTPRWPRRCRTSPRRLRLARAPRRDRRQGGARDPPARLRS